MTKRVFGYPKRTTKGLALTDFKGNTLGKGHLVGCRHLRSDERGSHISNQVCSYRFKVNGTWYAGRGYGEGMSWNGRAMKKPPRGFSGISGRQKRRA